MCRFLFYQQIDSVKFIVENHHTMPKVWFQLCLELWLYADFKIIKFNIYISYIL